MLLDDLNPYWTETHDALTDILQAFPPDELAARHGAHASVRDIVLDTVRMERQLIGTVFLGAPEEPLQSADYATASALIDAVLATRERTIRALEPLTDAGLRAVRTLPADPVTNRLETNVQVRWLFYRVLMQDAYCLGQVQLRWADFRRDAGFVR